jgi:hypothetical protein
MTKYNSHGFDFLHGSWTVRHRRLKERLSNSHVWEEFAGTSATRPILGGSGNIEENFMEFPEGPYRAAALRSFDAVTGKWAIWWLDARHPHALDVPVVGGFESGVGTFLAYDVFQGVPITIRFLWSDISADACRWQQAFSTDGGQTWETNWVMDFARTG